jgi:hypothetical protein
MNKLTYTAFAFAAILSTNLATAANGADDLEKDKMTKEMPEQIEPTQTGDIKPVMKQKMHKRQMHAKMADKKMSNMKMMDTNHDGMLSKEEYMAYHEQQFGKMKQTDGLVDLNAGKSMPSNSMKNKGDNNNSMNNKPIGTTTDNPNMNERDAVSGKKY